MNRRHGGAIWLVVWLSTLAAGCATIKLPNPPPEDVTATRKQRNEQAVRDFQQQRDAAEFLAARAAWRRGDVAGCQKSLERLLKRAPNHDDAKLLLAEVRSDPIHRVQPAGNANGPHECGHYGRQSGSEAVHVLGSPGRVVHAGFNGSRGSSSAGELIRQGEQLLAAGSADSALARFRQAIALEPDNPSIPTSAAVLAVRYNRPDLAVVLSEEAVRVFPRSAALRRTLAVAHYRRGDFQAAQVVLRQALSLDNSSALAYFLLGSTLAKLGQPEAAEMNFRQAGLIDPKYAAGR
jgi:tetratricopeptide (TPR) repeat protein